MRGIGWFSGGVTSAVAIKKSLEANLSLDIIFFETGQHHPDTQRFLNDCEKWFNQKITVIKNKKYNSVMDIFRKGYVNSPNGAFCTKLMKKDMRIAIEKIMEFDFQIFGFEYDVKQVNRAIRFNEQYPESKAIYPLIDLSLNKNDCFVELKKAGIEIPEMYKLGYSNNNCIGCVKGGQGYWNKVRITHPEIFNEMAKIERQVKATCLKKDGKKLYLDELDPSAGRHEDITLPECGVVCQVEMDGLKTLEIDKAELVKSNFFGGIK
jgi:3'-phosphoadenosine 5'-phosphosulfate sulfotransferase (PAPS reductase)/FAD synthetase